MKQGNNIPGFLLIILLSAPVFTLTAQEIPEKVAIEICNCVDTIENIDSLEAKVNRCAQEGLETVIESSSEEVQDIYSSDDAVEETITRAMETLMTACPKIRKYIIQNRRDKFYTRSSSSEANEYYDEGNEQLGKSDYKNALKLYTRALKKDPEYIYALDNTGLTYRKLGDIKKAIKYYNKSLSIYPEGDFALQNLAYAYMARKDIQNALLCYQKIAFFYPDDPEGYFGIGKLYVATGKYETAMDYVFTAHRIYSATKSEYISDSEKLISVIYNKLREQNKLDVFNLKAREYGINHN